MDTRLVLVIIYLLFSGCKCSSENYFQVVSVDLSEDKTFCVYTVLREGRIVMTVREECGKWKPGDKLYLTDIKVVKDSIQ